MTDETTTAGEVEEQAEESGYGAAEGETGDAPEQVLPTVIWTGSSSTRPARRRSPTSLRSGTPRAISSCSATRTQLPQVSQGQQPDEGQTRPLRALPEAARVGTVDKFQGQGGAGRARLARELERGGGARGLGFVFNANRISVATSRAQCRVELVCSPRLLEADGKRVDEMRLVNALCRFVELADAG